MKDSKPVAGTRTPVEPTPAPFGLELPVQKNLPPAGPGRVVNGVSGTRHIELNLRDLDQLFNSMDPSPFYEKDLNEDAAEFILSWAREFHRKDRLELIVYLGIPRDARIQSMVRDAVHNYFAYRARLNKLEFRRLLRRGRLSLLVGVGFLLGCFVVIELLTRFRSDNWPAFVKEGLTIAGWVAMWRPLETYLYDWWPLRREGCLLEKLSRMPIEVRERA